MSRYFLYSGIHRPVSYTHLDVYKRQLLSPVIILGCIYSGVASPTEAAVISVFYALIISLFVYKSIHIRDIWGILVEAIRTFTPILFILAASTAFSRVLTLMQVPQTVSEFILNNFHSPVAILLIINLFLLIVGMVMDTTPAILILTPILLPIVPVSYTHLDVYKRQVMSCRRLCVTDRVSH